MDHTTICVNVGTPCRACRATLGSDDQVLREGDLEALRERQVRRSELRVALLERQPRAPRVDHRGVSREV